MSLSDPDPRPHVSIIIPAKNEETRLPPTLRVIGEYLAAQPFSAEVIVVDDGSTDGTWRVVQDAYSAGVPLRLVHYECNRGKGFAVRAGVAKAQGDLVLFTDADNSTPIEELAKLRGAIEAGADLAIGSRACAGADLAVHQPLYREMLGRCFNLAVRALAVPGIADTQCGFKLFTRAVAEDVFPRLTVDRFSFDVELIYLACRRGYRVAEVPVHWEDSRDSRVDPFRDGIQMVRDLAFFRFKHMGGGRERALGPIHEVALGADARARQTA
jgi:dolichyl-phosphate beta-glucosyltransferase